MFVGKKVAPAAQIDPAFAEQRLFRFDLAVSGTAFRGDWS
jgi:hypothetical protein